MIIRKAKQYEFCVESDNYVLAISLNWSQKDDVAIIKQTSDPEIIHSLPTLPMQGLLVRTPPLWKFRVSIILSLQSFGF